MPLGSSALQEQVLHDLAEIGDTTPIRSVKPIGGGCISQAVRLTTENNSYFLKTGGLGQFTVEAKGLEELGKSKSLAVPKPIAWHDQRPGEQGYLLMEWLPPGHDRNWGRAFGKGLRALHQTRGQAFGLSYDNLIGASPQTNGWEHDWITFFRDKRLRAQSQMAIDNGCWNRRRDQQLEQICLNLESLIGPCESPGLLHGDLWSGNVLMTESKGPALIDPAIYFGDPEADIAMTRLFGGFPSEFYATYGPLRPGWKARAEIYNLYHLINHLNLFGESYGSQVDATLSRYS